MRIIKDFVGDVSKDGSVIHTNVRVMVNDKGRVAVFDGKNKRPPDATYADSEVTYRVTGTCSACKGYAPKLSMMRVWEQAESAHAS